MIDVNTLSAPGNRSYMIQLLIKITILIGWFSKGLGQYARLVQEANTEAAEERRLLDERALPPAAPTTFPEFSRLPAELRQQIWEEALPAGRVLMLQLPGSSPAMPFLGRPRCPLRIRSPAVRTQNKSVNVWTCNARVPVILHVNSEARSVALRHYRLGLAAGNSKPRIYVDFERDTIGLSDEIMHSPVGRNLWRLTGDLKEVRSLSLSAASAPTFLGMRQPYGLENVQELLLVDSSLWSNGILPRVAELDWSHWIKWQCRNGNARWGYGGDMEHTDEMDSRSLLVEKDE